MSNRCELFPIELYINQNATNLSEITYLFLFEEIKVQRIICQSTLYGI